MDRPPEFQPESLQAFEYRPVERPRLGWNRNIAPTEGYEPSNQEVFHFTEFTELIEEEMSRREAVPAVLLGREIEAKTLEVIWHRSSGQVWCASPHEQLEQHVVQQQEGYRIFHVIETPPIVPQTRRIPLESLPGHVEVPVPVIEEGRTLTFQELEDLEPPTQTDYVSEPVSCDHPRYDEAVWQSLTAQLCAIASRRRYLESDIFIELGDQTWREQLGLIADDGTRLLSEDYDEHLLLRADSQPQAEYWARRLGHMSRVYRLARDEEEAAFVIVPLEALVDHLP